MLVEGSVLLRGAQLALELARLVARWLRRIQRGRNEIGDLVLGPCVVFLGTDAWDFSLLSAGAVG
jgi:hypothetical protein